MQTPAPENPSSSFIDAPLNSATQFDAAQNLVIVHGQKLEALALALWQRVDAYRQTNPAQILKPLCVIVGHIGMARWLKYDLAKRAGIAANIEFILPSEWVQRAITYQLQNEPAQSKRFHTDSLRLAIYELLKQPERYGLAAELVQDPRARFALAMRMAVRFTQYLVYRSDWLLAIESGSPLRQARSHSSSNVGDMQAVEDFASSWQAKLWLALVAVLGNTHRGQLRQALIQHFESTPAVQRSERPAPLFCFGINQLAPDDLGLLRAYSRASSVLIFFPNPCQEYWADLQTRPKLKNAFQSAAELEDDFGVELGHPLLSTLGKHGQMLFTQLCDCSDQFFEIDLDTPEHPSALAALQIGINTLAPDLKSAANISDSIQILAADSALSELEALAERLHQCFSVDASLALEDVVIMAPNISRYAPLLAFVFAAKRTADGALLRPAIPYSVIDTQPLQQPVLQRLLLMLKLPTIAFNFDVLMQCLALPELMQRFGIDASLLAQMQACLEKGYFESGFSSKDWADQLALLESERTVLSINTLEHSLARLWLGYWMGISDTESGNHALDAGSQAGHFPVGELDGAAFGALNKLSAICAELRLFVSSSRFDRTPIAWASWLCERIDALLDFDADPDDSATLAGRSLLFGALDALVERAASLKLSPLPYAVLLAELERALEASHWPSARLQLEQGGVVCCGMVPMRTLPYKIVCVLGLQHGEFPRPPAQDSTDWLQKPGLARLGDRNARAEDNYLLIEALLAARSRLFLSYVAMDASTGKQGEPCAALKVVQQQLARMAKLGEPAYCFDVSATPSAPIAASPAKLQPIAVVAQPSQLPAKSALSLDTLIRFWKNPARYFLNHVLQAATPFKGFDEPELLSTRIAPNEYIETALVQNALKFGWQARPSWLMQSGKISHDALGMAKHQQASSSAAQIWSLLESAQPALQGAAPQGVLARCPIRNSLDALAGQQTIQLHGVINDVYAEHALLLQLNGKGGNGNDAIALQIKLALLQLSRPEVNWHGLLPNQNGLCDLIVAPKDSQAFLNVAIAGWQAAQQTPLLFLPKLALKLFAKSAKKQDELPASAMLGWLNEDYEFEFNAYDTQLLLSALGLTQQQLNGAHALAFFDNLPEHWQQFQHWTQFWFSAFHVDPT